MNGPKREPNDIAKSTERLKASLGLNQGPKDWSQDVSQPTTTNLSEFAAGKFAEAVAAKIVDAEQVANEYKEKK